MSIVYMYIYKCMLNSSKYEQKNQAASQATQGA